MKKTVLVRSLKLIMYFKKQFLKHNFYLSKEKKESYNFSYCMVLVGQQVNLLPNQRIININTILNEDDLFYGQYLIPNFTKLNIFLSSYLKLNFLD